MCAPCVGGSYYPNRACKSHGTCPMDHRARHAPATSRRKRSRFVPVAAARQRTRQRTTSDKMANHLDAPGNDTTGNTLPTPRPWQKRTSTSNFRTARPDEQNTHKQLSDNLPGKRNQKNGTWQKQKVANFKTSLKVGKSSKCVGLK